ncbi:hypothetical protein JCM14467A_07250 [Vulcanisaeta sp. JCM 14467]
MTKSPTSSVGSIEYELTTAHGITNMDAITSTANTCHMLIKSLIQPQYLFFTRFIFEERFL